MHATGLITVETGETGSKNAIRDGIFSKAWSDRPLGSQKTGHFLKYLGKHGRAARGMGIAGEGGE